MQRALAIVLATSALLSSAGRACSEQPAPVRAILDRAITATGGKTTLASVKNITGKGTGTYYGDWFPLGCTVSGAVQFPDQKRMELTFGLDGLRTTYIAVLNDNQGWRNSNGRTTPMNADDLAAMQADVYVNWLTTIVPLLNSAFQITALGQSQENGRAAQGIQINRDGRPEVRMYFDEDSGLLLRSTVAVTSNLKQQYRYGNYKSFQGVQRAVRQTIQRNGKKFMEVEFSEVGINQPLTGDEFSKP